MAKCRLSQMHSRILSAKRQHSSWLLEDYSFEAIYTHSRSSQLYAHAGSPLGLFLALRKVDPGKARGLGTRAAAGLMLGALASQPSCGDGLPAVHRMYNLYHPFDPVGYRCEIQSGPQGDKQGACAKTLGTALEDVAALNTRAQRNAICCISHISTWQI